MKQAMVMRCVLAGGLVATAALVDATFTFKGGAEPFVAPALFKDGRVYISLELTNGKGNGWRDFTDFYKQGIDVYDWGAAAAAWKGGIVNPWEQEMYEDAVREVGSWLDFTALAAGIVGTVCTGGIGIAFAVIGTIAGASGGIAGSIVGDHSGLVLEAAGFVPWVRIIGTAARQTRCAARGAAHWGNPETLARHFRDHGADFGAKNADDYARQASDFLRQSQAGGLPTKVDADGVIRVFDPKTNTFGAFNPDGTTRTFFKPSSPTYWDRQPGSAPWTPK